MALSVTDESHVWCSLAGVARSAQSASPDRHYMKVHRSTWTPLVDPSNASTTTHAFSFVLHTDMSEDKLRKGLKSQFHGAVEDAQVMTEC